jgi:hypothetical protein
MLCCCLPLRYCQGMSLLCGFLLCSFQEEWSFWILVCIIETIAPVRYLVVVFCPFQKSFTSPAAGGP